jgi:PIN domain nuclease of toxin-antitoxin system
MTNTVLLDTHIWFWWLRQDLKKISTSALEILEDPQNTLAISAASVYEVAFLVQRRRIDLPFILDI